MLLPSVLNSYNTFYGERNVNLFATINLLDQVTQIMKDLQSETKLRKVKKSGLRTHKKKLTQQRDIKLSKLA
jgi:hypothetical protein